MFDIVQALVEWLPAVLGVPCLAEVPESKPEAFLTVERTGGATSLGKDEPNVAVQAWAMSRADAAFLAGNAARALALGATRIPEVCSCRVGSTYAFPDPESRRPRYQVDAHFVTRL